MLALLSFQFVAGATAAFLAAIALALWKRLSLSGVVAAVCALAIVVPSFLLSAGILRLIDLFAQIEPETISDAEPRFCLNRSLRAIKNHRSFRAQHRVPNANRCSGASTRFT
jgi:hypothetical protein